MSQIEQGKKVSMAFSMYLADDTLVDEATAEEPMTFVIGEGEMFEGLETNLMGLEKGSKVEMVLEPEVAFGLPDPEAQQWMERQMFGDTPIEKGLVLGFDAPNGENVPGTIIDFNDNDVLIDFSHPLAGHTLKFNVEILDVV